MNKFNIDNCPKIVRPERHVALLWDFELEEPTYHTWVYTIEESEPWVSVDGIKAGREYTYDHFYKSTPTGKIRKWGQVSRVVEKPCA